MATPIPAKAVLEFTPRPRTLPLASPTRTRSSSLAWSASQRRRGASRPHTGSGPRILPHGNPPNSPPASRVGSQRGFGTEGLNATARGQAPGIPALKRRRPAGIGKTLHERLPRQRNPATATQGSWRRRRVAPFSVNRRPIGTQDRRPKRGLAHSRCRYVTRCRSAALRADRAWPDRTSAASRA